MLVGRAPASLSRCYVSCHASSRPTIPNVVAFPGRIVLRNRSTSRAVDTLLRRRRLVGRIRLLSSRCPYAIAAPVVARGIDCVRRCCPCLAKPLLLLRRTCTPERLFWCL